MEESMHEKFLEYDIDLFTFLIQLFSWVYQALRFSNVFCASLPKVTKTIDRGDQHFLLPDAGYLHGSKPSCFATSFHAFFFLLLS